ncbi:MAG TPA: glycerol-3-phosphate dehydrogenase [Gammaproteobacteria bacterium]|jgi:glycerol-3-phosphate dehydrogenase (NAD(P)+)|nr:MAG: glycerol-3-phosphate dehydrogenase [Candidatus Endolissoclinum sp. TMED55]PDH34726.1 MAG: glycerol-3-phosphate dehydrogenase [Candidatus Thioglobus sp. MED-G23]HAU41716.1 glycerol-3-phosphate dehydrogenase [Gammaproteobacteria bacterium]HBP85676.1 glycerol-3-phosphate dehydrogenase [Gammaproteobacteria bacterium]HCL94067.1 glycerol-3-phosphate dehydrogenase [Gammaproteobacteria bacterium]|tara:strand:- start:7921 stop:8931 length:1011 start_codon:yes stop_codon:yes gene_type:complete
MTALPGPTAVIGAGSWGTALALLLARCQQDTLLWSGEPGHAQAMARSQSNEAYLPGIPLEPRITPSDNFEEAANASRLVLAVPSHAFRAVLTQLKEHLPRDKHCYICWGTKGFEPDSSLLLSDVFEEVMDENAVPAVVSGPSFAGEVAQGLPSALTVAAANDADASAVAAWFRDARTRVYTSTDLRGVQLGGAIKNVTAIAVGISDGLGFGANARAALITRGLTELARLGEALGGRPETFMGLTGLGDLILTCTDDQSRNRRVGLAIGRGEDVTTALETIGQEAEGLNTARELFRKSQALDVEMPISEQVFRIVFENLDPKLAVTALLSREARPER